MSGNHLAVAVESLIGHIVVDPECKRPRECGHLPFPGHSAAAHAESNSAGSGHMILRGVAVVDSEPQNTFIALELSLRSCATKLNPVCWVAMARYVGVLNTSTVNVIGRQR